MGENENQPDQNLKWEYEEVSQNFRALADIRFKLLALIPPLGGVAVFLLSHLAGESEPSEQLLLTLISILGFLVTLGVTSYDQRNSELYDGLMARAKFLEGELKLAPNPRAKVDPKISARAFRGQFLERPPRGKRLFYVITLGHDNGLAFIYGSVLGAWFFPLIVSFLGGLGCPRTLRFSIGVGSATAMVAIFIVALLLLDPGRRRSASTNEETEQTPSGPEGAANTADRADENRKQRGSRRSSA